MRSHVAICAVLLVLAMFASAAERKDAPAPALGEQGEGGDISLGGIVFLRQAQNFGTGLDATVSHYFTKHFGIAANADLLRSDFVQFRENGYRAGPTVRFNRSSRVRLFARSLFGYSRFRETNTGPRRPYVNGFSFLVGAGGDLRLTGPIYARLAGDYEQNPDVPAPRPAVTHLLRLTMGLSYRFGGAGQ